MNTRHHTRAAFGSDEAQVGRLMALAIEKAKGYEEIQRNLMKMFEMNERFREQVEHLQEHLKRVSDDLEDLIGMADNEYRQEGLLLAAEFYNIQRRNGVASGLDFAAAVSLPLRGNHFADDHRPSLRRSPGRSDTRTRVARKTG